MLVSLQRYYKQYQAFHISKGLSQSRSEYSQCHLLCWNKDAQAKTYFFMNHISLQ